MAGCISVELILSKLDEYLNKNDYVSAEEHLLCCMEKAKENADTGALFLVYNELMGLCRKLGREDDALSYVSLTLELIKCEGLDGSVGAATAYLNCATVYKAFSRPEESIRLFERARGIYERELERGDERLGGLYNNMALTLVDLGRFGEANELYEKALTVARGTEKGMLSAAMTYLNLANAAESELGLCDADNEIQTYLERAREMLDGHTRRDGYYAFVCEKCASVFLYYGHFAYASELKLRSEKIYNGGQ